MHRFAVPVLALGMAASFAVSPALAQIAPSIAAAVADSGRPDGDRDRDQDRRPRDVLQWVGVAPGQKVGELIPAGGYFTRILAKAVGPNGHVYAVVPDIPKPNAANTMSLQAIADANKDVTIVNGPLASFSPPEKLDLVWTSENYHDLHNPAYGSQDMAKFDKMVFDALKPGGIFYIEDYAAAPGAGATQTMSLHRIDPATVEKEVEAVGFKLVGSSDILEHDEDAHVLPIFDDFFRRGHVDRFMLKFRKP